MNLGWISMVGVKHLLLLLSLALAGLQALVPASAGAYSYYPTNDSVIREVAISALPLEASDTLVLIRKGGPFPYSRDGAVFGNYEKRLPKKQRGYYHEYTVKTPGARSRGARRIVCGQLAECYYSDDHYQSFNLIRQ